MSKITKEINFKIDTEQFALGTVISSFFCWQNYGLLKYDREKEEILINEETLMAIIKMVNPAQLSRRIRILSVDEWLDRK